MRLKAIGNDNERADFELGKQEGIKSGKEELRRERIGRREKGIGNRYEGIGIRR